MAPVGSYESLNAAIAAGADSVYFGVEQLNMRAASSVNFTLDDLAEIVRTAHAAGVKTYLTVNIVIYDDAMSYTCPQKPLVGTHCGYFSAMGRTISERGTYTS